MMRVQGSGTCSLREKHGKTWAECQSPSRKPQVMTESQTQWATGSQGEKPRQLCKTRTWFGGKLQLNRTMDVHASPFLTPAMTDLSNKHL